MIAFMLGCLTTFILISANLGMKRSAGKIIVLKPDWDLEPQEGKEALIDYLNKKAQEGY